MRPVAPPARFLPIVGKATVSRMISFVQVARCGDRKLLDKCGNRRYFGRVAALCSKTAI
jgi:hypothetical protein